MSVKSTITIREFVESHGGVNVIEKILIANNGLSAVKGIRSIQLWAYETFGDEKAIQFVVMATPEDLRANAEYIGLADECIEVPGGPNNNNYANVELITDVAQRAKAHAVYAGWGHASENPSLPRSLAAAGIVFIGPGPEAMHALGDKISASLIAQCSNVAMLPWSGSHVQIEPTIEGLTDEAFTAAGVSNVTDAVERAEMTGYPLMVKASEGGGGRGIRKASNPEELRNAFRQVQAEVPGSPIFLMRLATVCRHLEVQVIGDSHGNVISLSGRDCSVQRRHQKIIEEGPPINVVPEVWEEMQMGAVRLAKAVGYVNAGTVEYLYMADDKYCFLELNPRLQVEHPVTEMITGVNLPACQLQIAMGLPLWRIPDIRRLYGFDGYGTTPIDFASLKPVPPKEHCIAARITAENPDEGFKPTTGVIHELNFRNVPNVWGYFGMKAWGAVHEYADSQIGHVFARGATREIARRNLVLALKGLSIRGEIHTTYKYLQRLLEADLFVSGGIDNSWLDGLIAQRMTAERPDPIMAVVLCGVAKAHTAAMSMLSDHTALLERGQVPATDLLQTEFPFDLILDNVKYQVVAVRSGPSSFTLVMNESSVDVELRPLRDGGLLMLVDGASHVVFKEEEALGTRLTIDGLACIFTKENDPSSLRAAMPCKLARLLVDDGAHVAAGSAYAEAEVMKTYLPLCTPEAGIIRFTKTQGSVLLPGELVATLILDNPSSVKRAVLHTDPFPSMKPPRLLGDKSHQKLQESLKLVENFLAGYGGAHTGFEKRVSAAVSAINAALCTKELPLLELDEIASVLGPRLPRQLYPLFADALTRVHAQIADGTFTNFCELREIITAFANSLAKGEASLFNVSVAPLLQICDRYQTGLEGYRVACITGFFKQYFDIECVWDQATVQQQRRDDVIHSLRDKNREKLNSVYELLLSHQCLARKNKVIIALLNLFTEDSSRTFVSVLKQLAELRSAPYADVSVKAKHMLMRHTMPSAHRRRASLERNLTMAITAPTDATRKDTLHGIVDQHAPLLDVLVTLFTHQDAAIRAAALEVYVRRAYRMYHIEEMITDTKGPWLQLTWYFYARELHTSREMLMPKNDSYLDILKLLQREGTRRTGVMAVFDSFDVVGTVFEQVLKERIAARVESGESYQGEDVLNLVMRWTAPLPSDAELTEMFQPCVAKYKTRLIYSGFRRVTFIIACGEQPPRYFTYRNTLDFNEDEVYRHVDPPMAFQLELRRLINYKITAYPSDNPEIRMYVAEAADSRPRFFVRAVVRQNDMFRSTSEYSELHVTESASLIMECVNTLELGLGDRRYNEAACNHIFLNYVPDVRLSLEQVMDIIGKIAVGHQEHLRNARITEVELRVNLKPSADEPSVPYRFIISHPWKHEFQVYPYMEVKDASSGNVSLKSIVPELCCPMDGADITAPYPLIDKIQGRRLTAAMSGTTYVYDFPVLIQMSLESIWKHSDLPMPSTPLATYQEWDLDNADQLREVNRPAGSNKLAMVAWLVNLVTPECPNGRPLVLIASDLTVQSGSFGPREDMLFQRASEYSRKHGIPRLYIAANSGARIGLAREIMDAFDVHWVDETDPRKGFEYLYLKNDLYQTLSQKGAVQGGNVPGSDKVQITDVIGLEDGLGVENLRGSGMIAGETSRAYDDVFTITYVTGRAVGIGAYLVRLGQRTVQNQGPIILTGGAALNKLLGREVYQSNLQLGGPRIMYHNGVTHISVDDELRGIRACLRWLTFVPARKGESLPCIVSSDPVARAVSAGPLPIPYDPRRFLNGVLEGGSFQGGFFDKGSFVESLAGWARTVVVGRARLGGIPMGVIAVETRTVEATIPADPATPDSQERVMQQAGQVWFPDSAFKTAQAIKDLNRESLPLMIFANWRGFSGGMRDMFHEILKFGSYIVDGLVEYKQPIFVYLPPHGELRGGAWVVVDATINPDQMEMYADPQSRGGVLEPDGTIEIKYRKPDLVRTMKRLDPVVQSLSTQLSQLAQALITAMSRPSSTASFPVIHAPGSASPGISVSSMPPPSPGGPEDLQRQEMIAELQRDQAMLQKKLDDRVAALLPVYTQIAKKFADLHDTAGRMQAKGVISAAVPWEHSREFFYWRLRWRLQEEALRARLQSIDTTLSNAQAKSIVASWIAEDGFAPSADVSTSSTYVQTTAWDQKRLEWAAAASEKLEQRLRALAASRVSASVSKLAEQDLSAAVQGLLPFLNSADEATRALLRKTLNL